MQQVDDTYLRWIWRIHLKYVRALDPTWFSSFTYWNSQQFTAALRVLFLPERPQNMVLQKYMNIGAFVLTIDDGREHLPLRDQEGWMSMVRGGTTIVMSIIMSQEVRETTPTRYQCPFCNCWNKLRGNRRLIGGSFKDLFKWCSADELSADPASDGSRSNQLNEILTRRKLWELPTPNGSWYRIFTCGKEWVLLGVYNGSAKRVRPLWTPRKCVLILHELVIQYQPRIDPSKHSGRA